MEISFGPCCFCARDIVQTATDPVTVTVTTADDGWQVWKAHGDCFKKLLTDPPDAPGLFEPVYF